MATVRRGGLWAMEGMDMAAWEGLWIKNLPIKMERPESAVEPAIDAFFQTPSASGLRFKDVSMEVGKDITKSLYLTAQGVFFNQVDYSEAQLYATGVDDSNLVWPSYGARVGLEYNMGRNRQLVCSVGYNVDDRLEPRPRVAAPPLLRPSRRRPSSRSF